MDPSGLSRRAVRFFPAAALYGLIFYLSSLERWPVKVSWSPFDKFAHASIFGLLGGLLAFGFNGRPKLAIGAAFGTGAVLAVLDEFHQLFVPGRDASPWDVLADLAGIALGIWLYGRIKTRIGARRARRRSPTGSKTGLTVS
jgi:VanZ family protein